MNRGMEISNFGQMIKRLQSCYPIFSTFAPRVDFFCCCYAIGTQIDVNNAIFPLSRVMPLAGRELASVESITKARSGHFYSCHLNSSVAQMNVYSLSIRSDWYCSATN